MATCKDCLHYDVCQALEDNLQVGKINPIQCGCFKDKSRYIELPCEVGEEIWVIDREDGEAVDISCVMFLAKSKGCIIATSWINDYNVDETIEYHVNETQNNIDTDLKVYPDEDCFLTCEEAEKALKNKN